MLLVLLVMKQQQRHGMELLRLGLERVLRDLGDDGLLTGFGVRIERTRDR